MYDHPAINFHCRRCKAKIGDDPEVCWYCQGPLCDDCWEQWGHCGHPEFEIVQAVPAGGRIVRFWDFAATKKQLGTTKKKSDPDYTASVKGVIVDGVTYILDMTNERMSPAERKRSTNRPGRPGRASRE